MENVIKVSKEFVKEAHAAACSDWRIRIEKECPELFPKSLEVGKWYKHKDTYNSSLVFLTNNKISEIGLLSDNTGYGFTYEGVWTNNFNSLGTPWVDIIPATDEEVKAALIKEAKKRGYADGNHKCLGGLITCKKVKDDYFFDDNQLWRGTKENSNCVFDNGQWAIIEQTKKLTRAEIEKLVGGKFEIVE